MDETPFRRSDDIAIAELTILLRDHIERYDRDIRRSDSERQEVLETVRAHDEFIREIKPLYRKGMMALGAIALGFIGLIVQQVWSHLKWG